MVHSSFEMLYQHHQEKWLQHEQLASKMVELVESLYRDKNIVISIYGRALVNRSTIEILEAHHRARVVDLNLSIEQTYPILEVLSTIENIGSAEIDLGKLAVRYPHQQKPLQSFVQEAIEVIEYRTQVVKKKDVVLYGFGRIGRILTRLMVEQMGAGRGLNLKAIVVRKSSEHDLEKRASLLRRDSIHGAFCGNIIVDAINEAIIVNGHFIKVIYSNYPNEIGYTRYGINNALLIDNTGKWRTENGLNEHLKSQGIAKVILTAPGKDNLKNIVFGVNQQEINDEDTVISAASCTTNAITPLLKVIHDKFTVLHGHVETIHSFTNDQNLIDNYHKADRRGRAATLNMVITETGAAKAVTKALPALNGKLTGNSVRVPTPNVSLAILNLTLEEQVTREQVNEYIRYIALDSNLQGQIGYVNSPEVVSSDFIGSRSAGIFDARATMASGHHLTVYVWYDNEVGYSCQVLRVAEYMSGIDYPKVPYLK